MSALAKWASRSPLWRLCKHAGIAPVIARAYWQAKLALNGWSKPVTLAGHTVEFATKTDEEYERTASLAGERAVIESLLDDLRPSDVVYDVGANIGTYACFAAAELDDGIVVAYEPMPTNVSRLEQNLAVNVPPARWDIARLALADENRPGSLRVENEASGAGKHALDADGDLEIEIRRGDDLVEDGTYQAPDVLKIDVEGAELGVLKGCEGILDDVRVVYAELHRDLSRRYGTSPEAIETYLRDHGFTVEKVNERSDAYHVRATR